MTATVIPWRTSLADAADALHVAEPHTPTSNITTPTALASPDLTRSSPANSTTISHETTADGEIRPSPIDRIYPHVFDENLSAGKANIHIQAAIRDIRLAIDAFGEPDLAAVTTHLGQIAAAMRAAFPLTEFNESLGGVVAFIRRATLGASNEDLSRSALNAMEFALQSIASNPLLELDEASDLIDTLSTEGWQGQHKAADELISLLLDESDLSDEVRQALLFSDLQTEEN